MLKSVMAYDFADERVVKSVDKLDSVQKMNVQLSLLMKLSCWWLVFVGPKFDTLFCWPTLLENWRYS
jgi:hypothetical protein